MAKPLVLQLLSGVWMVVVASHEKIRFLLHGVMAGYMRLAVAFGAVRVVHVGSLVYVLLCVPRWAVATATPLVAALLPTAPAIALYQYLVNTRQEPWLSAGISATSLCGVLAHAMLTARWDPRLMDSMGRAFIKAQLEMKNIFLTVVVGAGLIRAPALVRRSRQEPYGEVVDDEFKNTLAIWLTTPAMVLVVGTWYRAPPIGSRSVRQWCRDVWAEVPHVLIDIPFFATAAVLLPTFGVLRIPNFAREFSTTRDKWRVCMNTSIEILVDIPFFFCTAVVGLTGYRFPRLWKAIRRGAKNEWRRVAWYELAGLVLDTLCVPCWVVLAVTVYRFPRAYQAFTKEDYWHSHIFNNTLLIPIELVKFSLGAVVLTLGPHRLPLLFYGWRNRTIEQNTTMCVEQAVQTLQDLPFVVLGLVCLVFPWRTQSMVNIARSPKEASWKREEALIQFIRLLADIPCAALSAALLVTWYRAKGIKLRDETRDPVVHPILGEFHLSTLYQFKELLIDLPCIAAAVLGVLRWPSTIALCFPSGRSPSASFRRRVALLNFCTSLAAIPAAAGYILAHVNLFRFHLVRMVLEESMKPSAAGVQPSAEDELCFLLKKLCRMSLEGVFAVLESPMLIPMALCLWRAPRMWGDLKEHSVKKHGVRHRYCAVLVQVKLCFFDVLATACKVVMTGTVWQKKRLHEDLRHLRPNEEEHEVVFKNFGRFIADIPVMACIGLSMWRGREALKAAQLNPYSKRLRGTAACAGLTALDIVCGGCACVLLVSWRHRNAKRLLGVEKWGYRTFHLPVLRETMQLLIDLPYAILSPLSLWRTHTIVRGALAQDATAEQCRSLVLQNLLMTAADIICIPVVGATACIPWRTGPVLLDLAMALSQPFRKNSPVIDSDRPALRVTSAVVTYPSDTIKDGNVCGLILVLSGTKDPDFTFTGLQLHVEGSTFWQGLAAQFGAVVRAAKATMFPMTLTPKLVDPSEVKAGSSDFKLHIHIGTGRNGTAAISQKTLRDSLSKISVSLPLRLRLVYSRGREEGLLCTLPLELHALKVPRTDLVKELKPSVAEALANEKPEEVCELHELGKRCVLTMWPVVIPEVATLALSVPAFWRLPRTLTLLFAGPTDVATRFAELKKMALKVVKDSVGLIMLSLILVTGIRVPALVLDIREFFHRAAEEEDDEGTARRTATWRRAVKWAVPRQFTKLCLDIAQGLELVYIVCTMVQVPSLVLRARAMLAYKRSVKGFRERLVEKVTLRRKEGSTDLPHDVLGVILDYLPPIDQCTLSYVNTAWYDAANDNERWRVLFEQRFGKGQVSRLDVTSSFKCLYIEHIQQTGYVRRKKAAQHVLDERQGMRYVVHKEFLKAVERLPHFLLLPAKALGFAIYVANTPLRLLERITAWPLRREVSGRVLPLAHSFWDAHVALLTQPVCSVLHLVYISSDLLAMTHCLTLFTMTLGGVLWEKYMPFDVRPLLGVVSGLVLPWFVLGQAFLLFMPFDPEWQWWAPSNLVVIVSVVRYIAGTVWGWVSSVGSIAVVPAVSAAQHYVLPFVQALVEPLEPTLGQLAVTAVPDLIHWKEVAVTALHSTAQSLEGVDVVQHLPNLLQRFEVLRLFLRFFEGCFQLEVAALRGLYLVALESNVAVIQVAAKWGASLATPWVGRLILRCCWVAAVIRSWFIASRRSHRYMPSSSSVFDLYFKYSFRLIKTIITLPQRVAAALLRQYGKVLALATSVCNRLGLIGDCLLIPITLAWAGWPFVVPYKSGNSSLYLTATVVSSILTGNARRIIRDTWK